MKEPSHSGSNRAPGLPRTCGSIALALATCCMAVPAAAQVLPASEIVQPAPFDSSGSFGALRTLSADGDTVVVGDRGVDTVAPNAGAAYVYQRDAGVSTQFNLVQTLTIGNGLEEDAFGNSTAVQDDTLVVGARGDDTLGLDVGAAHVFNRINGTWVQGPKLLPSDGLPDDSFSAGAVAIDGDTIAIASVNADSEALGPNSGAVYIFSRNEGGAGNWGQVAKLQPPGFFGSGFLGRAIDIQGDRIAVGSFRDRVFIFNRTEGTNDWVLGQTVVASDDTANREEFGNTGLRMDGNRLMVTARTDNNERGEIAGTVYIFEDQGGTYTQVQRLLAADGAAGFTFGRDATIQGDLLIVGHNFRRPSDGRRVGLVNVYEVNPRTNQFEEVSRLTSGSSETFTQFGFAVEFANGTPLVGASADTNTTGRDAGTVFAYDLENISDFGDAPAPYPTLLANDGARHGNVSPFEFALGARVDAESDGQPLANALGDDRGNDDEDGVAFPDPLLPGETGTVSVTFTGPNDNGDTGLVSAWVDFNRDGDWSDEGERILLNESVTNGENLLEFEVPIDAIAGVTHARFRLTSAGVALPTGAAADGEVEDHVVDIGGTPTLTIKRVVAVAEGNEGSRLINVPVTLSRATDTAVTATFTLSDGSARAADGDYVAGTGTVRIAAGRTRAVVQVAINGDIRDEITETLRVRLTNLVGALPGNLQASVRIRNDDLPPTVTFDTATSIFNEGLGRTLTVRLSAPSGKRIVIPVNKSGTATAGSDYGSIPNNLIFNRGQTEKTIRIQSNDDATIEGQETVILTLGEADNVTLGEITQHTATIRASD